MTKAGLILARNEGPVRSIERGRKPKALILIVNHALLPLMSLRNRFSEFDY
jgi:hypothetical protein